MGRGRKTGGKDFAPGVSGNPAGRPPEPEEFKAVRRLTKAEIAECGALILDKTVGEIQAMAKDPTQKMLNVMLAGMAAAAAKGNPGAFDKLLDRLVGKQKDRIEVSGALAVRQRYDAMSDEELQKKLRDQTSHVQKLLSTHAPATPPPAAPPLVPPGNKPGK